MLNAAANRGFELTRGFVDLLHESVLAEVPDEALVAVEDGSDVLVAGVSSCIMASVEMIPRNWSTWRRERERW